MSKAESFSKFIHVLREGVGFAAPEGNTGPPSFASSFSPGRGAGRVSEL
jgi:hypothetical protein